MSVQPRHPLRMEGRVRVLGKRVRVRLSLSLSHTHTASHPVSLSRSLALSLSHLSHPLPPSVWSPPADIQWGSFGLSLALPDWPAPFHLWRVAG